MTVLLNEYRGVLELRLKKIIKYLTNKQYRFLVNAAAGRYNCLCDEAYLRKKYRAKMGREIDLDNPRTFNEKLNWLKLYYRNPLYPILADKHRVKEYVAEKIGEEYIIPTLGVWDSFSEINFNELPNQFVLKCTHDSGGLVICKDKKEFDLQIARKKISKSLERNYYLSGREWQYNEIPRRIIGEQYLEDVLTNELRDYKFFCFNGIVKAMFIATDRQSKNPTTFDFFDDEFNHLDIRQGHPNAQVIPEKPLNFDLMKKLAETLSVDIPQVRVDFYEVNGHVYFGEMTFFHFDGTTPFDPPIWDEVFGKWIELPNSNVEVYAKKK